MSTALADLVQQSVDGQRDASYALAELKNSTQPDVLHRHLQQCQIHQQPERVRAFVRVLEKQLGRVA